MLEILGFGLGWLIGKKIFHKEHEEPQGIFETDEEFLDFIKLLKLSSILKKK